MSSAFLRIEGIASTTCTACSAGFGGSLDLPGFFVSFFVGIAVVASTIGGGFSIARYSSSEMPKREAFNVSFAF